LLASTDTEVQVQGQPSSPAGRLVGRDHFLYRIPVTHVKLEGKSQRSCRVCAERSKHQTGKTEEMHNNVLAKMRCRTLCRAVFRSVSYQTELLGVTVTFIFSGSAAKTLFLCNVEIVVAF
jgi:ribosomal protein S14